MRHTLQIESINELTEAGLHLVGEQRQRGARRLRLLRVLSGLEEADQIELQRAKSRVGRAKVELREACDDLDRIEEISVQKAEIRREMFELDGEDARSIDEAERAISITGQAAGFAYARAELIGPGGVERLVEQRRRVRIAGAAKAEVEAI